MPFVVELYFDPATEASIRDAWKAIDDAGISDSMSKGGYRPHVSLAVCDHLETDSLAQELSIFAAGVAPFRLSFPNIGIFSTKEVFTMKTHEFTLILTAAPNEEKAERLYSIFDDGTIATVEGVPQIHFHREAFSLESAIVSALLDLRKAGFDAVRVRINPKVILGAIGNIDLRERGIDAAQAAEMRARLASFAEDWESPEMNVYDNYDEEKAKLQTR